MHCSSACPLIDDLFPPLPPTQDNAEGDPVVFAQGTPDNAEGDLDVISPAQMVPVDDNLEDAPVPAVLPVTPPSVPPSAPPRTRTTCAHDARISPIPAPRFVPLPPPSPPAPTLRGSARAELLAEPRVLRPRNVLSRPARFGDSAYGSRTVGDVERGGDPNDDGRDDDPDIFSTPSTSLSHLLAQASTADPMTLRQALESDDAESWSKACEQELKMLKELDTWDLVDPRAPSAKISDGNVDNIVTLYRLRRASGRPPDRK